MNVSSRNLLFFVVICLSQYQKSNTETSIRQKRSTNSEGASNPPQSGPRTRRTVCDSQCVCQMPTAECRRASLRSIPSPFPRGVEKIIIAENPLSTIKENSFYKAEFASLTNLQLNDNQIKNLEAKAFHGLGNVRELSIKGNKIREINELAFYGLRNLETLILSSNQLRELSPGSFTYGMGITTMVLNDNKLEELASDVFEALPSLQTLSLGGNPWSCDCDLLGIFVWLQRANTELREPDAECAKPPNVAGKTLQSFTNKEMQKSCVEDDGEDDEEPVEGEIDEACAEHNSTNAVDICYISDTIFAQPGKRVCIYCAATVDPLEIERDLSEETGYDLILRWEGPTPTNEEETGGDNNGTDTDSSDGSLCFDKIQAKDGGTYTCFASFGNMTDDSSTSIIVNDLANKVGIGIAIFFGIAIVVAVLLVWRWWLKEVRALENE